jgi:DNA-binding NarL/FixJ family response regulator
MTLTPMQRIVAAHIAEGLSVPAIAARLQRSPRTIEKHVQQIADTIPGDRSIAPMRRILRWALQHT